MNLDWQHLSPAARRTLEWGLTGTFYLGDVADFTIVRPLGAPMPSRLEPTWAVIRELLELGYCELGAVSDGGEFAVEADPDTTLSELTPLKREDDEVWYYRHLLRLTDGGREVAEFLYENDLVDWDGF